MIGKIGVRAHDFGKNSLQEMAEKVSGYGFETIQLALQKALTGVERASEAISGIHAKKTYDILSKHNIEISVLGCYLNYGCLDEKARNDNIEVFLKHIDFANGYGARMVATEAGSLNADYSFNHDNHGEEAYRIFLSSIEKVVRYAEDKNVTVALEAVSKHIINTPLRTKRIIDDIVSPNLAVILDVTNITTTDNYKDQNDIIKQAFDLYGDKIMAIHVKDFVIKDGIIKVVPAGKGQVNWRLICELSKKTTSRIDFLLENIKPEFMNDSKKFLQNLF